MQRLLPELKGFSFAPSQLHCTRAAPTWGIHVPAKTGIKQGRECYFINKLGHLLSAAQWCKPPGLFSPFCWGYTGFSSSMARCSPFTSLWCIWFYELPVMAEPQAGVVQVWFCPARQSLLWWEQPCANHRLPFFLAKVLMWHPGQTLCIPVTLWPNLPPPKHQ